jgi:hypothetical protein
MIIKSKKNCKLIFEPVTNKYYVKESSHLTEYRDLEDAFRKYGEINKINRENRARFYENGLLKFELYPEQVFLITKSIEIMKFFVDNSFFFNCDRNNLEVKSTDLFYLYQSLYMQYSQYVPKKLRNKIEENYNFKNFRKLG